MCEITTSKLLFGVKGYDMGLLLLGVVPGLLDIGGLDDRLRLFCGLGGPLLSLGVLGLGLILVAGDVIPAVGG